LKEANSHEFIHNPAEILTVDELNGTLGLDGGHSSVNILGNDVSAVHEAASHVLSVPRIAFGHHASGLKYGVGNLSNGELFVVGLLGRDDGCVGGKHEVDARVWNHCEKERDKLATLNRECKMTTHLKNTYSWSGTQ
jgi:hypothetical protein